MFNDEKILQIATKHRRYLHKIPEIEFEEYKTTNYISNHMQKLGYEIETRYASKKDL